MNRATQKICLIFLVMSSILLGIGYSLGSPENHNLNKIINTSDSDTWAKIVKTGDRRSTLELWNNSLYVYGYSGHISKFDASGSMLWEYPLALSNPSHVFDTNGNLLICGEEFYQNKFSLIKISSSGNLIYSKNITREHKSFETLLTLGENNSIILTSQSYVDDKLYIFKLNSDGNSLWNTSFSVLSYLRYPRVVLDSMHNFYITYYNNSYDDLYLAKVNSTGEIAWQIEVGDISPYPNLMIDCNDTLFFIGAINYDTHIFKINTSGSILAELVVNDFSTSMDYNWLFGDIIIITEYYPSTFYCYDADLNYKWNFNLSEYVLPYHYQPVNLLRDSQGNIFILQSSRAADISLVKINSTGYHISQLIWGGPAAELLRSSVLDSDNNLYFLCQFVYSDTWRRRHEYTVLVKNPINGGVPPIPERKLDLFDFILFSVIGIAVLISLGMLLSILKNRRKIIK
ncbi:MAG: hypothetical protein ACXABG_09195 [Promethearchaeota archaeon]|jgi:hypothetical protein